MGWENVFHCEWEDFPRKILNHYWPNAQSYGDIKQTDFTIHRGEIDILTGGFPCQPYSSAGKRLGKEDDRHLWPEMLRSIREVAPTWVVGENVRGLINWNGGLVFDEVQADLEAEGYEVQPFLLPACGVNAPHRRDRIWFVANSESNGNRLEQKRQRVQRDERNSARRERMGDKPQNRIKTMAEVSWEKEWIEVASELCGADDGLPRELDGITFPKWRKESIKAYGNAIVPQIALMIFKSISKYEELQGL